MDTEIPFKQKHPLNERIEESKRVLKKHPDKVPVIVQIAETAKKDFLPIKKTKYLVPVEMTIGQFVYVLRKQINISADKAVFVFVNGLLPPTAEMMGVLYNMHKDIDGFIYCIIQGESVFG